VDISGDPWRAGQALMEFGQRICSARPRCPECPVRDGCPGPGVGDGYAGAPRRQPPFEGSVRQRRGLLLRRVLDEGSIALTPGDREVAEGLASDGLAVMRAGRLCAPVHEI
jgi:hypothetical protein